MEEKRESKLSGLRSAAYWTPPYTRETLQGRIVGIFPQDGGSGGCGS